MLSASESWAKTLGDSNLINLHFGFQPENEGSHEQMERFLLASFRAQSGGAFRLQTPGELEKFARGVPGKPFETGAFGLIRRNLDVFGVATPLFVA